MADDDPHPPPPERARPLEFERIGEKRVGELLVRYPLAFEAKAERAAEVLRTLVPVVGRYLGVTPDGALRLDLLEEARASGANPAVGVVRHAVRGFDERSPRTAGLLSYQVGRILWYRGTAERDFGGVPPRHPDWLVEAALLPLTQIWTDRAAWLDHVAEQVGLFAWRKPLPPEELVDLTRLSPRLRMLASAQCLLRAQSLEQRVPDWVRRLVATLAAQPDQTGLEALQAVTGADPETWEQRFAADLEAWRTDVGESAPGFES